MVFLILTRLRPLRGKTRRWWRWQAKTESTATGGLSRPLYERRLSSLVNQHRLVAKVPYAREQHCQPQAICGGNHFGIALRPPGLNDGGRASLGDLLDAIGKREKSVGRGDCSLQRQLSLHGADFGRVHAAHLSGAHANGLSGARVDDGVRLNVLADLPGE